MEKILGLLHEGTIVNIRMMFTIAARYKSLLAGAFVLFFTILGYNFYNQPTIYAISIPIIAETSHKISTDLSSLLPMENAEYITLEELNASLGNHNFLQQLAANVYSVPEFEKLNWGSPSHNRNLYGLTIKKKCSESRKCTIESLTPILKDLYYLEQDNTSVKRFKLTINTIDSYTAKVLGDIIAKTIEKDRVRIKRLTVEKEIENVSSLISESRTLMQKMGGYEVLHEQEILQNNILSLKEKLKTLQINSTMEEANLSALKAKLSENKKRTVASLGGKEKYDSLLKTYTKLNEIKQNLLALSHIPEEKRSAYDKKIISQLTAEHSRLLKSLPGEDRFREIQSEENFKDKQFENSENVEFDYVVSKNKIVKLNENYEQARSELDELLKQQIANETKINGMKTDLDFLKGLESKLMSLKLIHATMSSDLIIEEGSQFVEEFRKHSFLRLVLFSFFISAFLYIISLVTKYTFDDKIYGEDDIRLYFKELDFVGETPSFDK